MPSVCCAGLEPAGDDGYFQTANWFVSERAAEGFEFKLNAGRDSLDIGKERVSVSVDDALNLAGAPLFKVGFEDSPALEALTIEQVEGKAIVTEMPDFRGAGSARRRARNQFFEKLNSLTGAIRYFQSKRPLQI